MTTLHDRLADLAEEAPQGLPAPDLWGRGRRLDRRRRVGTGVIAAAACLALVAIVGVTWHRSGAMPEPAAPPDGQPGLPSRLFTPSPWLPGTMEGGPLGSLAVVVGADRGSWTGTEEGLVGVSATTGEYRFLDLPDRTAGDVALSPDGRKVAYWTTGGTTGSPQGDRSVTGLAVYDTTNGDLRRADIDTEHGLAPNALLWADDGDLVLDYGQYRGGAGDDLDDQSSSTPYEQFRWQLDQEAPAPLPLPRGTANADIVGAGRGRVVLSDSRTYWNYDPDELSWAWPMLRDATVATSTQPVFEISFRFAAVRGSQNPNSVVVGEATGKGGARTRVVPDSQGTYEVLGWAAGHVVVERKDGDRERARIDSVDVDTGEHVELVRLASADDVRNLQLATDLFDDPTIAGVEPPDPVDPRTVTGLLGLTAIAGIGGVVVWRRRVRP
jgi:hypothetical protein